MDWFETIYWCTLASTSVISGLMITVILMPYNAVTTLIAIIGLDKNHPMLFKGDKEETDKKIDEEKDNMN